MGKGSCLCGDISYRYEASQSATALHCHCRDCQKVTGSGKATIVMFPEDAVAIEGTFKQYSCLGSDGSHVNRGFCPRCGSQMFTHVDEIPGMLFIKAASMTVGLKSGGRPLTIRAAPLDAATISSRLWASTLTATALSSIFS